MIERTLSLCAVLLLSSCIEAQLVPCGDLSCPVGSSCVANELCASPDQIQACTGIADGGVCTLDGNVGRCDRGVCVGSGCGNHVVDPGEECDDGNVDSGDGCRGDCRKVELCGDAILDGGEDCDDGNANAADGCDQCVATTWTATSLLGGSLSPNDAGVSPWEVVLDGQGNLYIADVGNGRIRRIAAGTSVMTTVAGTGSFGSSGDGGAATSADLATPYGLDVDGLGNIFIADAYSNRIRRVDASSGVITTVAVTGVAGRLGDNGPAEFAQLSNPYAVVVDGLGNLYIADTSNNVIRRVDSATGIITTVAGNGTAGYSGDGSAATSAQLRGPHGIALDRAGNLFITDTDNQRIRRVDALTQVITTVAGTGTLGFSGDGDQATGAQLYYPEGVSSDAAGNLYVADTSNHRIRRIDATTGIITTVVGAGPSGYFGYYSGDGGPATAAQLFNPHDAVIDANGNLYVADSNNLRVRRVDGGTGIITTFAGTGAEGAGDGGAATSSLVYYPQSVAIDTGGNVFITDTYFHRIRRIDASTGTITTVAGTGTYGSGGDGGPATSAGPRYPQGLIVDPQGNLIIADTLNHRVRRVAAGTGVITTIAGTTQGFGGDGGPAAAAQLNFPTGLALDAQGNLFVADTNNNRIRRIDAATNIITTIAGTGSAAFGGDDGPATSAQLFTPCGIRFDGAGNLYVADLGNHRIREIAAGGTITTVAGTGTSGSSGDGGPATSAQLFAPQDIALDAQGDLYIADSKNYRVRRVSSAGTITTFAGTGVQGESGDGGAATSADLGSPVGVSVDATGRVYIVDRVNHRLRRVDTAGVITTVAGAVSPEGMGPRSVAHLVLPQAFASGGSLTLFAGGASGTVQAMRSAPAELEVVAGRYPQTTATAALARFRAESFGNVGGIAYDAAAGVIYLSETTSNRLDAITIVDAADENTWTIATLAGSATGTPGFADGAASVARFRGPTGLFLDGAAHVLYVADTGNHAVRAIQLTGGSVSTVAGTPARLGFSGDGALATSALLYEPTALTRCANGDLFIADTGNNRIRRVAASTNVITTVLGDGVAGSSGTGGPATSFSVNAPRGVACDAANDLYVTSTNAVRLLPADIPLGSSAGVVDGTGPVQTIYGAPHAELFPASVSKCLTGIGVVDADTVQVTDSCTGLWVELSRGVPGG